MKRFRAAPKVDEIYSLLKQRIQSGFYQECGVLPTENVLAEELGVSRKTLRSALARLALENIVERVKGKGTFIRSGETAQKKILVIVGNMEDITDPGRYILPGILQEAAAVGIQVETCTNFSLSCEAGENVTELIKKKDYCGILSFSANFMGDEPIIGILKNTSLPVVLVHALESDGKTTGFAVMGTDYRKLIRDGLQYLAHQGHRRVSYLAYHEHRIPKENYFELLREIGLDDAPCLRGEMSSSNDEEIVYAEISAFFDNLKKLPTAVFCFSDFFAVCLYRYLKTKKIRIPEDMAVLSIGGLIGCDFLSPPLSTMDLDCQEIGRQAVRILLEMKMKNILTLPFIVTAHYLTERESTRQKEAF